MIKLFFSEEVLRVDNDAIQNKNIPSLKLMENAGEEIFKEIKNTFPLITKNILIVCGKGNNGGDGLVVARKMIESGFDVKIFMIEKLKLCSTDFIAQHKKIANGKYISSTEFYKSQNFNLVVDAIFGTSFKGEVNGEYKKIIEKINSLNTKVVSIDIPSGLNSANGEPSPISVKSNLTISLALPKVGLYLNKGKNYSQKIKVVDIGIPKSSLTKAKSNIFLIEKNDIVKSLPKRKPTSHKHSIGKIFALCGSKGLTGAAILSTQSAMRSGAGAVILGIAESQYEIVAKRNLEVMTLPLSSTKYGTIALSAFGEIKKKLNWCDLLLIGPGLSQNEETKKLVQKIVESFNGKIVLDADGINSFIGKLNLLRKISNREIILTPHIGEFARLLKIKPSDVEKNQIVLAKNFSKRYKVTLVLKSASTIIASPNGKIFVNQFGNSGMATAGSGDVLSGIVSSIWAQGADAEEAAICAVGLHSISGDIARNKIGERSMIASDLIKFLPKTFKSLE